MFQKRFVAAAALALVLVSSSSYAMDNRSACFAAYYDCVNDAANLDGFWRRAAAGLDCAVDLYSCIRSSLVSW